jgi:hypothetical protein
MAQHLQSGDTSIFVGAVPVATRKASVKLSICPPSATMSGSSAGASGFDVWDRFLDRAGIEDGEGVEEMEAEPMSAEYFRL